MAIEKPTYHAASIRRLTMTGIHTTNDADQSTHTPDSDGHGSHAGHDKHAGHDPEMFRRLFWWNLILAIPVLVFSEQIQDWFGYSIGTVWSPWIAPVIGTLVYVWGGRPFLAGGVTEIRSRQPGMMLLIALAITVAYVSSLATSLGWGDLDFWWELAALVVVMLLGHWQEMKAIGQAQGALAALAELLPDTAERVTDDAIAEVAASALEPGDIVLVRPGGRVPADGVIVAGDASFDESMITGESRPVHRREASEWWPAPCRPTPRSGSKSMRWETTPPSLASSEWLPTPNRPITNPSAGRPGRRAVVLPRHVGRRGHHDRLVTHRARRRGGHQDRHGVGHRLSPCARTRHSPGDLHLNGHLSSGWDPGQRPSSA